MIEYIAEVTSIGNIDDDTCYYKVGDRVRVRSINWGNPKTRTRMTFFTENDEFCLMSDCAYLNGGTWKLMPQVEWP